MGGLNNKVVGDKNSYSNFEDISYFNDTFAIRKKTPYYYRHHQQHIIIRQHKIHRRSFSRVFISRTISSFRTKGKQMTVI